MRKIYVYGASGHGKVVADILISRKDLHFAGFVDDARDLQGTFVLGLPVCGDGDWLRREAARTKVAVALGVGSNCCRKKLAAQCVAWGAELLTAIHPTASVSSFARVGCGTMVMAQAVINAEAKIGDGVIVNTGAVIEHDVEIGDFAHVAPQASLGGAARLGPLSQLGIGAVIIQCVSVGANSLVGAGAVVVKDLPHNVVAYGVPARIHKNIEH